MKKFLFAITYVGLDCGAAKFLTYLTQLSFEKCFLFMTAGSVAILAADMILGDKK